MIEIKSLYKKYPSGVTALVDINLTFGESGLIFLLGKSGCGKSTMLNVLGCLDRYEAGEVVYNGISSKGLSGKQLAKMRADNISFIFQDFLLIDGVSTERNLRISAELQGKLVSDADVSATLNLVDMDGYQKRKPTQLSAGQKQRIGIARALIKQSSIILADEPTGNLDSQNSTNIFDILKRISKDKLIVVASHDEEAANNYADRIIRLHDGKVTSDQSNISAQAY